MDLPQSGRRLVGLGHKPSKLAIPGSNPGDRTKKLRLFLLVVSEKSFLVFLWKKMCQTVHFWLNHMPRNYVNVSKSSQRISCCFELRRMSYENCYNTGSLMDSSMGKHRTPVDLEKEQKFDGELLKRLAKVIRVLPNLED